jgi:hypothetical protein
MSAFGGKTEIRQTRLDVRLEPKMDISNTPLGFKT